MLVYSGKNVMEIKVVMMIVKFEMMFFEKVDELLLKNFIFCFRV